MRVEPVRQAGNADAEPFTVSSLRRRNRATVLKHIILARQTTRATIARDSGLSAASVISIVSDLIADNLVEEAGSMASRGGRPIGLLRPRGDSAITIGADIGERGVAVEMFDLAMNRIDREFRGGSEREPPDRIAADLTDALTALRDRHSDRWTSLLGIGLGLPGIVETDHNGRQILFAQSLGWGPVRVTDLCTITEGVHAENGAKMQARAELWYGAARGCDFAVVALLGRGVGLGVISEGRLARGSRSSAGEWGHMVIERNGRPCACGSRGCVEAYIGSDAILADWKRRGGEFDGTGWRAMGALLDAADSGDAAASEVLDETIDCLGAAIGGLVNMHNPQRIVIGGWVGLRLMESVAARIHTSIESHCLTRPGQQFELAIAELGGDSVAIGSALLPIENLIAPHR
ncbi:ROK family protein [Micromonospora thermarum]|uniref:ROK family protein n=1 Tax=Micromonospora thermarum TaxID=2720024 RepID=A0ABX0ZBS3_9ACTN|nr:ROK family protein [Micromonospora thermarum]NJP35382.1 ROK family protein [Micromonospora thermarum]